MKKIKFGAIMLFLSLVMMGFATATTPFAYAESVEETEISYTQADIDWDTVTKVCISQEISMDFGIPKEECSGEFIDKISTGNFTEDEIYSYFCSNFPEYPNLVVEALGTEVVIAN